MTDLKSLDGRCTITMPHAWTLLDVSETAPEQSTYEHKATKTILGIRSRVISTANSDSNQDVDKVLKLMQSWEKLPNGLYLRHDSEPQGASRSVIVAGIDSNGNPHIFTITMTGGNQLNQELWKDLENAVRSSRLALP